MLMLMLILMLMLNKSVISYSLPTVDIGKFVKIKMQSYNKWFDGCFLYVYLLVGVFASWQHPGLLMDWCRLMTVRPHGDFIVLPHWEIRLPAPRPEFPLSWHADLSGSNKYQLAKSLFWLCWDWNPRPSARQVCTFPIRPPRQIYFNADVFKHLCIKCQIYRKDGHDSLTMIFRLMFSTITFFLFI